MTDPFTDEDRERVKDLAYTMANGRTPPTASSNLLKDPAPLYRALAHIDHLEKALEKARVERDEANIQRWSIEEIADLKGRLERKTTRLRSTLRVIAALEDEHTSADTREDVVRRLAEAILCDPELLHGHPDTEDTTGVAYEAAERIAAELGLGVSEAVVEQDREEDAG